ncbi:MAG: MarR family winged helix-turn-helix transcriptional regulator [Polaromonas sp.]
MTQVPREPLENLLLYRLSRLVAVAGRMVTRLCEGSFAITRREWRLLITLASLGELSSSQLADHAQLDRARTSKTVSSLVAKALVSRMHRAGDRRQVMLRLTVRGRALYDELFPLVSAINAELGKALNEDEIICFDDMLMRLQTQAESMLAVAVMPKADRQRLGATAQSVF